MNIDVVPTAAAIVRYDLAQCHTVVIDALRASSTIAQAIASGARRVIPMATIEDAREKAASLATPAETVGQSPSSEHPPFLGGEREGLPPPGFDLGNSPREYTPTAIGGRTIVYTTTNGTPALLRCAGSRETLIGAFVNLPAVVERLARRSDEVLLVAVGRHNVPVLDDLVCAGMFVNHLVGLVPGASLTDVAQLTHMLYDAYRNRIEEALRLSPSGHALTQAGLEADLPYCAQVGIYSTVPSYAGGEVAAARD